MKFIIPLLLFTTLLFSKTYYAKVEPYELRVISSNVSGLVLFIDEDMIGKKLNSKSYIEIDAELDNKELKYIGSKLIYLKKIVDANQNVLSNLEKLLDKKRANYDRVKLLKIKSSLEKDREFYDLVNSENQYLNTMKEINNLKIQIADLKLRKNHLTRSVKDKNLKADGFTLYSIEVKVGQVVGISTLLAKVADISKAKLTIYLDAEDLEGIEEKSVYLDGKRSEYKVSRVLHIADTKNISKYMAQIIIKSPKTFSKLLKVELK